MRLMALWSPKVRDIIEGRAETLARLERLPQGEERVWIHVASLGEFEQARPLIEAYRARHPEAQLVLSFFSSSGYRVRKDYSVVDAVVYLPADTRSAVRRFLDVLRPSVAIFVKYDFWPTMLTELARREVKTYLAAAIFREGQLFFRPWGGWYRGLLRSFDYIFVQDATSASLLRRYGIDRVQVSGDTRFDRVHQVAISPQSVPSVAWLGRRYSSLIVAGSTWAEDNKRLMAAWASLEEYALVLVPHELHAEAIDRLIEQSPRRLYRLSSLIDLSEAQLQAKGVEGIVVDSIGLLSSLYRYATVAYVGGGFGRGIHNTLEAAVYGVPVVFGPKIDKFREARALVACGGAFVVRSVADLQHRLQVLATDPEARADSGVAAGDYVRGELGATEHILSSIERLLYD